MTSALPTAVENFQRYLRIKTVQPQPDYPACTQFLQAHAEELGLPCTVIEVKPGKPVVIITWEGKDPSLPSIGLNSHTDVVPVYRDHWTHDPFSAEIVTDDQGEQRIYARGTQDMKIVGWGYLEAIRNLKAAGHRFLRTVHLLFVPDEEIGSEEGMKVFVHQPEFKALNIGFMLDEGVANPEDAYYVFYAEKSAWWTRLRAEGQTGHGS
ncbi:adenylate cyclase, partial [Dimargaris xerosporica]